MPAKKQRIKGRVKEGDQSNVYSAEEVKFLKEDMKEDKKSNSE